MLDQQDNFWDVNMLSTFYCKLFALFKKRVSLLKMKNVEGFVILNQETKSEEEETMINTVTLVGRLANDVDLRYTRSGTAVGQFRLAVNRTFTNQAGEREADFISCVIWRKAAETLTKYARKGSLIGLTGHIQTRNYDNAQGQRVYVTEVVIENYQLLESKEVSEQRRSNTSTPATFDQPAKEQTTPVSDASNPFSEDVNPAAISDDELPF